MTKLGGDPRSLWDGRPRVHDILTNNASGLLGRFIDIILNEIFPYLILGSLFGASAGGKSLIKLAFRWTRRLRGGPAHAAIVSSAMFGTISGGPIVNVLSTGVLTIPMMIRRGFSPTFAGGVEAAASSGGSIMPPVMGVAAFVLAALTAVPYSEVIVAAAIPAIAYFFCLFLSAVFQSRKQKIEAFGEMTAEMHLSRQDIYNLLMIFGPILVILFLLLTSKENVGCGWFDGLLGAERVFADGVCKVSELPWFLKLLQNAAGDAGSAGWWAVALLCFLLFLDPEMRARPRKLLDAFSDAGILISTLYLMFLAVSIIDFCLKLTGLPFFISLDVLQWLQGLNLGTGGSVIFQFMALGMTMLLAVLLGMGMPAVPAYINVALLMGPVLAGLGISIFTAHMFIFYFAVASAITPPVALAAFAASSITKAEPMATGFSAVRSGHRHLRDPVRLRGLSRAAADRTGGRESQIDRWRDRLSARIRRHRGAAAAPVAARPPRARALLAGQRARAVRPGGTAVLGDRAQARSRRARDIERQRGPRTRHRRRGAVDRLARLPHAQEARDRPQGADAGGLRCRVACS